LTMPEFVNFKSGDQVGKTGLEREYNNVLIGKDGFKRVVVNSFGRQIRELDEEPYIAGNDLVTTIDLDLQRAAETEMADHSGAVVALDPRTGEIIKGNVTLGSLRGRQDYLIAEALLSPYLAGRTFTRYFWQLELDEDMRPTGRDIVSPPGPPSPR